jgi:hypothetical protein
MDSSLNGLIITALILSTAGIIFTILNMVVPNIPNQITCTNVGDETIKELDSLYKTNKFKYTCVTTCK